MTTDLDYDVDQLSEMFIGLVSQITSKWNQHGIVSKFSGRRMPKILYKEYVKRLMNFSDCSKECWFLVLIYLDRLTQKNLSLDSASIYTLTLTAMVLSIKYMEDTYRSNRYFARLGGVCIQILNELEIEMLFLLDFQLYVNQQN